MQIKKKVLILTDDYPPNNNANGICSYRYAKTFCERGYEVHVLCFWHRGELKEEKAENIYIHRWRPRLFFLLKNFGIYKGDTILGRLCYRLAIWMHRLKGVLLLPMYPLESPIAARRFCRKAEYILKKYRIDNIIAGFMPVEGAVATIYLKKNYPVKVIYISWDTFTNTDKARKYKFIYNVGMRWEKQLFKYADIIAHLKANMVHYNNFIFDDYKNKFYEIDIPFPLQRKKKNNVEILSENKINLMYMGGISLKNTNLKKLIEIINKMKQEYIMHFFTRGDAEGYLHEQENMSKKIVCHGQVPLNILQSAQDETDVFVTLGPTVETEVNIPSKIFECMGSGKIWIHIYKYLHDVSLPYVEKYPLGLAINSNDPVNVNVKKMQGFIESNREYIVTEDELRTLFPESSTSLLVNEMEGIV